MPSHTSWQGGGTCPRQLKHAHDARRAKAVTQQVSTRHAANEPQHLFNPSATGPKHLSPNVNSFWPGASNVLSRL